MPDIDMTHSVNRFAKLARIPVIDAIDHLVALAMESHDFDDIVNQARAAAGLPELVKQYQTTIDGTKGPVCHSKLAGHIAAIVLYERKHGKKTNFATRQGAVSEVIITDPIDQG